MPNFYDHTGHSSKDHFTPEKIAFYQSILADILAEYPAVVAKLAQILPEKSLIHSFIEDLSPETLKSTYEKRFAYSDPSQVPPPEEHILLTVVFDLDETLLHAEYIKETREIHTKTRAFVLDLISILSEISEIRMIVWSAGDQAHVASCLNFIDPQGKIQYFIHRDGLYNSDGQHSYANWSKSKSAEFAGQKKLNWLRGCEGKIYLVDDSIKVGGLDPENPVISINPYVGKMDFDFDLPIVLCFTLYSLNQIKYFNKTIQEVFQSSLRENIKPDSEDFLFFKQVANDYDGTTLPHQLLTFDDLAVHMLSSLMLYVCREVIPKKLFTAQSRESFDDDTVTIDSFTGKMGSECYSSSLLIGSRTDSPEPASPTKSVIEGSVVTANPTEQPPSCDTQVPIQPVIELPSPVVVPDVICEVPVDITPQFEVEPATVEEPEHVNKTLVFTYPQSIPKKDRIVLGPFIIAEEHQEDVVRIPNNAVLFNRGDFGKFLRNL